MRAIRFLAIGIVGVAACDPVPPQTMRDIQFPEGFALDTARTATLRFEASPTVDVAGTTLLLATPSGDPVFEGPASYAVAHDLALRLPPGTEQLKLTVQEAHTARAFAVPLQAGRTVWTLR